MAGATKILAVVVAYRPDAALLRSLLAALAPQVQGGVVINNGTELPLADAELTRWGFTAQHLGDNLGVAAALNRGFDWALGQQADFVISFDQDSEPAPDMLARMLQAHTALLAAGQPVGALGPQQVDRRSGRVADAFAPVRWRHRRLRPLAGQSPEVDHLITSGCLVPAAAWQQAGPMLEPLFIDYVDIEWSLRARSRGLKLFVVGGAMLQHALGDGAHHWRGRQVAKHGPLRHYYLVRNGLWLQKLPYIPWSWKLPNLVALAKKFVFFSLASRPRGDHIRAMLRGLWAGLTGKAT